MESPQQKNIPAGPRRSRPLADFPFETKIRIKNGSLFAGPWKTKVNNTIFIIRYPTRTRTRTQTRTIGQGNGVLTISSGAGAGGAGGLPLTPRMWNARTLETARVNPYGESRASVKKQFFVLSRDHEDLGLGDRFAWSEPGGLEESSWWDPFCLFVIPS